MNPFKFIFKKEIISKKVFILITIIAIIIASTVYFFYERKQDKLDREFEKSRIDIQEFTNNLNKK